MEADNGCTNWNMRPPETSLAGDDGQYGGSYGNFLWVDPKCGCSNSFFIAMTRTVPWLQLDTKRLGALGSGRAVKLPLPHSTLQ
jgi:hypothetical protein